MKNISDNHYRQFVNFIVHYCSNQKLEKVNSNTIKLVKCPSILNDNNLSNLCFKYEDHYGQTLYIMFKHVEGTNSNEYAPEVHNETPKGWLKIKWWDENLVLTD